MAIIPDPTTVHRPRNVDWKRAAALLYGDWGTSKAYVIGLAFVAAGFSTCPIILAVCILTAVVAYNYIIVCAHFPDGGGVYSAARQQSRFLASTGALLLVANFIVTAALSGWAAVSYLGVPSRYAPVATMALVLAIGVVNYFGPKHSGSVSIWLAIPAVIMVALIVILSAPHLGVLHAGSPSADLGPELAAHKEDMLRFLAEQYGTIAAGPAVGQALSIIVGVVFGLLLLSAVNTAIVALIGVVYMMAQDGEMPRRLAKLNSHGVP